MNQREKIMGIVTAAAIGGYLLFAVVGGDEDEAAGGSKGEVEVLVTEFNEMARRISDAEDIYRQFHELVGPEGAGGAEEGRPDLEFQRVVGAMCENAGFPKPQITKGVEEIKGVDDYLLVLADVDIRDGDLMRIANLMRTFDQSGLIIRETDLRSYRDTERMSAQITVARLVPFFPYEGKRR